MAPPRVYRVFDMDGCAAVSPFLNSNGTFTDEQFELIHEQVFKKFEKDDIFMSGSSRTSAGADLQNAIKSQTHSLTHYVKRFARLCNPAAKDLNIDQFLFGDIASKQGNVDPKKTWRKIEEYVFTQTDLFATRATYMEHHESLKADYNNNHDIINDVNKILLLYAIIQHIANQDPKPSADDPVDIHFYDDRKDILEALEDFYTNNPAFIPQHVKLHLYNYYNKNSIHGEKALEMKIEMVLEPQTSVIEGTGVHHPQFKKVVHQLHDDHKRDADKTGRSAFIPSNAPLKNAQKYIDLGTGVNQSNNNNNAPSSYTYKRKNNDSDTEEEDDEDDDNVKKRKLTT